MVQNDDSLRLLVVDDSPAIADQMVQTSRSLGLMIRMQLLDDIEILKKSLRQNWDILLFVKGYELTVSSVLEPIQQMGLDLPVIAVIEPGAPADAPTDALDAGATDVLMANETVPLVYALRRELRNLNFRRQYRELKSIQHDTEQRVQLLLKNSRSAIAYIDDGVHIFANDTYLALFDYSMDELIGMPVIDLVARHDAEQFKEFLRVFSRGDRTNTEFSFEGRTSSGDTFHAVLQLAPASHEGEPCLQVIIARQAADAGDTARQLAEITRRDMLTGLGNRLAFEEALVNARAQVLKSHQSQALLFISLDNIGQIRATNGLAGMDTVIQQVAQLLVQQLPDSTVARFGDTTFAALIPASTTDMAGEQADQVRQQIADALISMEKRTVRLTVSIGVALIGEVSPDPDELLARAYQAVDKVRMTTKGEGNGINVYRPSEHATSSDTAMQELLEEAIRHGHFRLLYQPLYDTQDEAAFLFEVYVRLPLADGRLMTPDEFMPAARQLGLEGKIDRWVLINACKQLKAILPTQPSARLLINLSAESLQDDSLPELVGKLNMALGASLIPRLLLQFSEPDVSTYLQVAQRHVELLHQQGCLVSINNFGSTLSALSQLALVPVDLVKLDKSFVNNLTDDSNYQAATQLVQEANALGRQVIVSYIENAANMSRSWSMGARYLQGYYLQPPGEQMIMVSQ